jgi:membrane associated rhomboid family serine protease
MKEVNLRLINRCLFWAGLAAFVALILDALAAYNWWHGNETGVYLFGAPGMLFAVLGYCITQYPKWSERRNLNAMLHSDNGNYVDPV